MSGATPRTVELEKLLTAAQLPALPQSAIKLVDLSKDPDNGPPEFATAIECDPGLAGQVLRFVNSSYFGFAHEIASVKQAVSLVGIRTIKNFSLWSAVFSLVPNPRCGPLALKSLWCDSLRRGLFARAVTRRLGQRDAEEAFAAALLQDMAVPILAKALPQEYTQLLERRAAGEARLSVLEQQTFGWNHAQAGGLIARQWKLPAALAGLVERHTVADLPHDADSSVAPAEIGVRLSALLPAGADPAWTEGPLLANLYQAYCGRTGDLADVLAQVDEQFAEFAPVLKLASEATPLVEQHRRLTVGV